MFGGIKDIGNKVEPHQHYASVQRLLDQIAPDTPAHTWQSDFYSTQMWQVVKSNITFEYENDGMLDDNAYSDLLKFITDSNIEIPALSQPIQRQYLMQYWNRSNPNEPTPAEESLQRFVVLYKITIAYVLLERLRNKDCVDSLSPKQKQAHIAKLNRSIANLLQPRARVLEAFFSFISSVSGLSSKMLEKSFTLMSHLFNFPLLKESVFPRELDIVKNIPLLWRLDLALGIFWRNLFWVSRSAFKMIAAAPAIILFLLPSQAAYLITSNFFSEKKSTDISKLIFGLSIPVSLWVMAMTVVDVLAYFSKDAVLSLPSIAFYLGAMAWSGPFLALVTCVTAMIGLGTYRSLAVPILDYFGKIEWMRAADLKNHIVTENNRLFTEAFEQRPNFNEVVRAPIYIAAGSQVGLSNQDLETLKTEIVKARYDNESEEVQNYLLMSWQTHINSSVYSECTIESYKTRRANEICSRSGVSIEDTRPIVRMH